MIFVPQGIDAMTTLPPRGFAGHLLPGVVFVVWGLWWIHENRGLRGSGADVLERVAWVSWAKLFLAGVGIAAELSHHGLFRGFSLNNVQHATMYAGFGVSGVVDLLAARGRVDERATYVAFAVAAGVAGLLFLVHPAPGALATTAYMLVVLLFVAMGTVAAYEVAAEPSRDTALLRAGLMLFLGVWFVQIAWLLHAPGVDPFPEEGAGIAGALFARHALAVTFLVLLFRGRGAIPEEAP